MKSNDPMIGKQVDHLTIVERAGTDKRGRAQYRCRCKCGKTKITTGWKLRRNKVRSCGCLMFLGKNEQNKRRKAWEKRQKKTKSVQMLKPPERKI